MSRRPGGDCGEPPLPPPPPPLSPPTPARRRLEADRRGGGPGPPREGRGTQGGDATAAASTAARQAPPVGRPLTPALPPPDRRLCADAVDRGRTAALRSEQTKQPASVSTRERREGADRSKQTPPPPPHLPAGGQHSRTQRPRLPGIPG